MKVGDTLANAENIRLKYEGGSCVNCVSFVPEFVVVDNRPRTDIKVEYVFKLSTRFLYDCYPGTYAKIHLLEEFEEEDGLYRWVEDGELYSARYGPEFDSNGLLYLSSLFSRGEISFKSAPVTEDFIAACVARNSILKKGELMAKCFGIHFRVWKEKDGQPYIAATETRRSSIAPDNEYFLRKLTGESESPSTILRYDAVLYLRRHISGLAALDARLFEKWR